MKIYYNGNYKFIDNEEMETIYYDLENVPNYRYKVTEIEVENGTTKIKKDAFKSCYSLKSIKLPDSLKEIDPYAFGNCKSLTRIIIPENTKNISSFVFYMCLGLNEVVFENNPDFKINYNAFTCCESLNSQTKEKLFYQIAKNVEKYDIKSFF